MQSIWVCFFNSNEVVGMKYCVNKRSCIYFVNNDEKVDKWIGEKWNNLVVLSIFYK